MYKHYFTLLAGLAVVAFALSPAIAEAAQHGSHSSSHGAGGHGGSFHGSNFHGSGFHGSGFHGSGFHGSGFHGSGFHGSGFHGGNFRGPAFHGGSFHGNAFHGGAWHGRGWGGWHGYRGGYYGNRGWGWGYPYGALGWGLGYPWYSGYAYNPSDYYDMNPYDYDVSPGIYDYGPDYAVTPPGYDSSVYSQQPAAAPVADNQAHVRVIVPTDARVWFGATLMPESGTVRDFVSPPLTPGEPYTYQIKAQWIDNGREVTQTRTIEVTANAAVTVDFTQPPTAQ
jgi:uncharacterized protein (TIGR03000 family)